MLFKLLGVVARAYQPTMLFTGLAMCV